MVISLSATARYRFGECILVVGDPGPATLESDILRVVIVSKTGYVANCIFDGDIRQGVRSVSRSWEGR